MILNFVFQRGDGSVPHVLAHWSVSVVRVAQPSGHQLLRKTRKFGYESHLHDFTCTTVKVSETASGWSHMWSATPWLWRIHPLWVVGVGQYSVLLYRRGGTCTASRRSQAGRGGSNSFFFFWISCITWISWIACFRDPAFSWSLQVSTTLRCIYTPIFKSNLSCTRA